MRKRGLQHRSFEWLCACLIFAPCAALAQQTGAAPQAASGSPDAAAPSASAPPAAQASGNASSAAPARAAPAKHADDLEPAVDTSAEGASPSSDARAERGPPGENGGAGVAQPDAHARTERDAKQGPRARASGKAIDHLELGTTDITGNRELPKVMYIVPWKRSDLGDLTGKPLNSLVDQTLEPVDRNVFERSNRYYGAVTAGAAPRSAATGGASSTSASSAGAAQDVHPTPGAGSSSAARDER